MSLAWIVQAALSQRELNAEKHVPKIASNPRPTVRAGSARAVATRLVLSVATNQLVITSDKLTTRWLKPYVFREYGLQCHALKWAPASVRRHRSSHLKQRCRFARIRRAETLLVEVRKLAPVQMTSR
ncbi:MAG TPA: hypothetical protein VI913_05110 [Candidatus Peribacteraceae bacterium]|nr:hypothetical protein [Candidatus Peribacteraceae bacterium]